jgi:hypothetical protein
VEAGADEDGVEAGVGLVVGELVGLEVGVGLVVADPVGVGLRELGGELDGVGDGDAEAGGAQVDAAGTTAGAFAGEWVVSAVTVWLPLSGLWAAGLGAGWPAVDAPVIALAVPLLAVPPPVPELCPDSTVELSWTIAWRSGGTAMATPAANTAQAKASAGRSIRSRTSNRGRRLRERARARVPWADGWSSRDCCSPEEAALPSAARAGPDPIFDRIRSRPSGRGSTCSAAACSAERTRSAKSCG